MLHAGDVPSYPRDLAGWDFRVSGEVDEPLTLTWAELDGLPKATLTQDIHCVTRWSRFDAEFTGVPWSAIRERVGQRPSAHYAIAHAEAGFTANVPASYLEAEGALLVTHADGEPLTPGARLAAPPRRPRQVLLEERQVAPRGVELATPDEASFWGELPGTATTPGPRGRKSGTPSETDHSFEGVEPPL